MFDLNDLKKQVRNYEKDDLLRLLGVEERRTGGDIFFTSLGIFAAGVLVGAGAALLLAPKTGAQLRTDLRNRIQSGTDTGVSGQISGAQSQARSSV